MGGIDPSLFFDTDGRAFIVNNDAPIGEPLYDGHRALWVQEFDTEKLQLTGPRKMIVNGGVDIAQKPIWIEGPHFFRRDGQLYLIAAEGGTALQHSQVVFKGDSVFGPFTPYEKNPILTQRHLDPSRPNPITSVGHADFVQDGKGNWWATFLGVRPYRDDFYNTGRETFLMPVRWVDGWPEIVSDKNEVPYAAPRPALAAQPKPQIPTSGNFTLRDDFENPELAPYWVFLRQPRGKPWYQLGGQPGSLAIRPRGVALGEKGQPSFIARRQQHTRASATTALHFRPTKAGERAGLVAFQSGENFYFFGIESGDSGAPELVVRRRAGSEESVHGVQLAAAALTPESRAPIYLRISARGDRYDFLYSANGSDWQALLKGADGTLLSTATAGGFVGATFGLYAYRD